MLNKSLSPLRGLFLALLIDLGLAPQAIVLPPLRGFFSILLLAIVLTACHSGTERSERVPSPPAESSAEAKSDVSNAPNHGVPDRRSTAQLDIFTDITRDSGVKFVHFNDASARRYLPETMGSGAAFFDYDGDGRPDLARFLGN